MQLEFKNQISSKERKYFQVESSEVDGHRVELFACPCMVVHPKVITHLICIPFFHLLKIISPDLGTTVEQR